MRMKRLPTEIMQDIVSRLPYETIINCKLVCKPWRDMLSFIKAGLLFQIGDIPALKFCYGGEQYDDIDMPHGHYSYNTLVEIDANRPTVEPLSFMVGSSNGLVCFSVKLQSSFQAYDPIYICNPITEEYVYLPKFNKYDLYSSYGSNYFSCGFGYHHSRNEYKVVRIYNNQYSSNKQRRIQVYTLSIGHGWRDIGGIDHRINRYFGVCVNGAIHWLLWPTKVLAFDLADEKFRVFPLPPTSPYNVKIFLRLLGGYLCVVHRNQEIIHIWALEKKKKIGNYDVKEHEFDDFWRWSKKFSIPCPKDVAYSPFAVTKSYQVLMLYKKSIICYDSETEILRELWDDSPRSIRQAIPHVNSHVSLEELGEKSRRRR